MTRIRRGYIARRRRKKFRLFASSFRGSRLTRTFTQQKIRSLVSAHRDRVRKKKYFRRLWIVRINAVIRGNGIFSFCCYSLFIHNLHNRQCLLNRKILAQIAISNRNCLSMIFNEIIKINRRKLKKIHRNFLVFEEKTLVKQ